MRFLRLLALLLIIAASVWFLGKQIEALQKGQSNPGVYKEAIDSAKAAANKLKW